jgi:UDP:flavonoid glycosyltransferase YjiC (YdhE family)
MLGALLAWEHGSGRGHVVQLRTVAEAVQDRFTFDAALCDLTFKDELAGLCDAVQGPWLPYSGDYRESRGSPPRATWGEFLGDYGFLNPETLRESIAWWQGVMRECDISLVIADCAPCALMAARGLGIPAIAIGTGYLVPPAEMQEFPVLLPRYSTRIYDEAEIVDTINSVVPEFGVPKLDRLPQVYTSSDQLAFTIGMLDPYSEWRRQPLLPPIIGGDAEPVSGGEEVFVYFSTRAQSSPELIEAIGSLGVPVRVFIPGIDDEVADGLAQRGVLVERSPVPVDLVAKRSRLLVNAAQHGTLCLGLATGIPQVSAPQQREQQYNAEAVEKYGVLKVASEAERSAEHFRAIVLNACEDAAMARRSRELADELRPQLQANRRKLIRRRISSVMDFKV